MLSLAKVSGGVFVIDDKCKMRLMRVKEDENANAAKDFERTKQIISTR